MAGTTCMDGYDTAPAMPVNRKYEKPVISRLTYVGVVWPLKEEDVDRTEKYFFARQHLSFSPTISFSNVYGVVADQWNSQS